MRNSQSKKIDYQIKENQNLTVRNKSFKTTNINILLNRVKIEKKNKLSKKIFFSIFLISTVSFMSIIVFGN